MSQEHQELDCLELRETPDSLEPRESLVWLDCLDWKDPLDHLEYQVPRASLACLVCLDSLV